MTGHEHIFSAFTFIWRHRKLIEEIFRLMKLSWQWTWDSVMAAVRWAGEEQLFNSSHSGWLSAPNFTNSKALIWEEKKTSHLKRGKVSQALLYFYWFSIYKVFVCKAARCCWCSCSSVFFLSNFIAKFNKFPKSRLIKFSLLQLRCCHIHMSSRLFCEIVSFLSPSSMFEARPRNKWHVVGRWCLDNRSWGPSSHTLRSVIFFCNWLQI